MAVPILQIILGLFPLLFGRRLFWLFVGITGFLLGILLGEAWFPNLQPLLRMLVSVGIGVLGAVLAIIIQKPMAMVVGFLALGLVALLVTEPFAAPEWLRWVLFLVAGATGAFLVALYFDWALIIVSALQGAGAISAASMQLVPALPNWVGLLLTALLAIGGIAFQARDLQSSAEAYQSRAMY